jgi:hypothetical protein
MKTDVEIAQTSAVPKQQQQAAEMCLLIVSFQNSRIQVMFWVSHNL